MDGTFNPFNDQPYTPFLPKLLLNSCHKDLLSNSKVRYINVFKNSVPSKWFLRSGIYSDLAPVSC